MADSDITTTLPFVTRVDDAGETLPRARTARLAALASAALTDPAANLALKWIDAHAKTQALCVKQQELESGLDDQVSQSCSADELRKNYAVAVDAENLAAAAEQVLLDALAATPAQTISGIVGKLTMILGECEDNSDASDFPGPHIRSVLDDLSRIGGQGGVVLLPR